MREKSRKMSIRDLNLMSVFLVLTFAAIESTDWLWTGLQFISDQEG